MAGPSKGIRLSFLAQQDQNKYETVFSQASNGGSVLSAVAAKDVLSRSNIGDDNLAHIWDLSNVTNQPQLTFPEFALAMYLTSMKMTGRTIPGTLPDEIRQEIRNAVNAVQNNGNALVQSGGIPAMNTGMPSAGINPTGVGSNPTGMPSGGPLHSSASAPQLNVPQPTGYSNLQPNMTGIPSAMPSVAMPTGMHGNTMAFSNRMMPGAAGYSTSQFQSLSSSVKIPWAVTDEEKKQYTKIFRAWDKERKGVLSGEVAKEIFSQSGLAQNVLVQIWNLSDPHNNGKLNIDEFSVAMHLIYRKLNGYNVPETLPPELVPPSTRDLNESVDMLKKTILEDIAKKRNLNNFSSSPSAVSTSFDSLSPPTPYRSRSLSPARPQKKEKDHDDDKDVGYVSSARRMGPDRTRLRDGSSPQLTATTSSYGYRGKQTRIFDLRKEIDEKKKYIQKLSEDSVQKVATPYNQLSALDKRDIDDVKDRVKELQEEISKSGGEHGHDAWNTYIEKTAELSNLADQEKSLEAEIQYMLNDTLKGLLAQVDETEDDLKEKKIQAAQQKAKNGASSSPDLALDIVGTGPNGEVTESDRIRAKAKALVAARMGKITGKPAAGGYNAKADIDKINQEREEFKMYTDSIADSIREMEQSLNQVHMEISMIGLDIRKQDQDQKRIEERGRFEYGENVARDLKDFISELNYTSALAKAPEVDPTFESRFPSF
ncbi:hypothetical protein K501DRAFT_244246 [Backusella circina FSU 941]|nr:hypothetical protein K501DRAFT_244246 [Backusella circina FSU 941]